MTEQETAQGNPDLSIALFFKQIALAAPAGQRIVDIGAGDGRWSRIAAKELAATMLHLVDDQEAPCEQVPACPEQQWRMSAEDPQLIAALKGKVDTIIAMRSIHELERPIESVVPLLRLFEQDSNGLIYVMDYTRDFWTAERLETFDQGRRQHAHADVSRTKRTGLYEPADIQTFWEHAFRQAGHQRPTIAFENTFGLYWLAYMGNGPLWDAPFTPPAGMLSEQAKR